VAVAQHDLFEQKTSAHQADVFCFWAILIFNILIDSFLMLIFKHAREETSSGKTVYPVPAIGSYSTGQFLQATQKHFRL
jgi:hypothetical protein